MLLERGSSTERSRLKNQDPNERRKIMTKVLTLKNAAGLIALHIAAARGPGEPRDNHEGPGEPRD